jgi:galactokinase
MTQTLPGNPPVRLLVAFQTYFPTLAPEWLVQPAGREMWAAAACSTPHEYTIAAPDFDGRATFSLQSARQRRTVTQRPLPAWARYPAGVITALDAYGLEVPGMVVVIMGDEPPGPRYEYAMGIAVAALWHEVHARPCVPAHLIALCDRVRREYVEVSS